MSRSLILQKKFNKTISNILHPYIVTIFLPRQVRNTSCFIFFIVQFILPLIVSIYYSLLGAIFPLPRILYAMANDGLLFKFLSNINETTKTPLISTVICGVCAGKTECRQPFIQYFVKIVIVTPIIFVY